MTQRPSVSATVSLIDPALLPSRPLLDSGVVIRALEHESPKFVGDPRTQACRELWVELLRSSSDVLIAAPSLTEYLIGPDPKPFPRTKRVIVVSFDERAASQLAHWAGREVLVDTAKTGAPRDYIRYDAMIVACAKR